MFKLPWHIGLFTFSMAILMYVLVNFEFFLLLNSFEPVAIQPVISVLPLIMLINLIPVTFAGLGVREGASLLLLKTYGVSEETAVNAAILLFVLNVFLPALIGGFWMVFTAIRSRFLKKSGGMDDGA